MRGAATTAAAAAIARRVTRAPGVWPPPVFRRRSRDDGTPSPLGENNERAQQRVAGTTCRKTHQLTRPRTPRESPILRIAFRWSLTKRRTTPTVPAWISTKRRAPPVSATVATTCSSACAVHQSAKGSWHQPRIWAPSGRRESTPQAWAVTPRCRFSEASRPHRPPASTIRHFSMLSGKSTCIPSRWWDEARAVSKPRG